MLDCFSGTGLGGLDAALAGYRFIGVELESRFHALAHGFDCGGSAAKHEACSQPGAHAAHHVTGNLELWARRYSHLPQYVAPTLLQGDSRELGKILREHVTCCVSSPPFQSSLESKDTQFQALVRPGRTNQCSDYGTTEGQLAALPPGTLDACLSSPPFCDSDGRQHGTDFYVTKRAQTGRSLTSASTQAFTTPTPYGTHPAQLGNLPAGQVECAISSPPFMHSDNRGNRENFDRLQAAVVRDGNGHGGKLGPSIGQSYGESPGQLGNDIPSTFWDASKQILQQVFDLLRPNGIAIFVVKDYVRDGAIVPFSQQWRTLAEHCGFVTLHIHHALLVEDHGTQGGLFGADTQHRTKRVSFFRRLHEKKRPDLAIDHETVLCLRKPADSPGGAVAACCASPPYAESLQHDGARRIDMHKTKRDGDVAHQRHGMIDSGLDYGTTPGQLGSMTPGSLDLCLSSPPYAESLNAASNGIDRSKLSYSDGRAVTATSSGPLPDTTYGTTPGQLGGMAPGSLDLCLSSPPYAALGTQEASPTINSPPRPGDVRQYPRKAPIREYGTTPGQLGAMREGPRPHQEEVTP